MRSVFLVSPSNTRRSSVRPGGPAQRRSLQFMDSNIARKAYPREYLLAATSMETQPLRAIWLIGPSTAYMVPAHLPWIMDEAELGFLRPASTIQPAGRRNRAVLHRRNLLVLSSSLICAPFGNVW